MKTRIKNTLEMFGRAGHFDTTPGLPANALAATIFTQLKAVELRMQDKGTDQASGYGIYRGGASDRGNSAQRLRGEIRDVVKAARALDPAQYPGAGDIRSPRSASYQALLAAARAILEQIGPIKSAIVAQGAPTDFDETIQGLIADVEEATRRKSAGRSKQSGGTAGLLDCAKQGVVLVKRMDAIMTYLLRNDPSLQAAWKSASRIESAPVSAAAGNPAAAPALAAPSGTGSANPTAPAV